MRREVHLHLGVHRTATTFIQHCLRENAELLLRKNVKILTPKELRPNFTTRVEALATKGGQKDVLSYLQNYMNELDNKKYKRVVFSEENLIGHCGEPLQYGGVYETAERRIGVLKDLFANRLVKLFICLRDYASYLPSAYIEETKHKNITFDDYISNIELDEFRWKKYIDFLVKAFPKSEVIAWDYSRFGGDENIERVFEHLVGERDFQVVERDFCVFRRSLSQKSIDILNILRNVLSASEMKQIRTFIIDSFKEDGEPLAFNPWTTDQKDSLLKSYRKDLEEISRMERVTLLFEGNSLPVD
jgi:hypothetical protein